MKISYLIAMTTALSFSATVFAADEGEALFKKSGCNACHATAGKGVGPSLKEIAAKYRGDIEAPAKLEAKMRSGGSGNWGKMPMPPVAKSVSDENIKVIIQWVLSLK